MDLGKLNEQKITAKSLTKIKGLIEDKVGVHDDIAVAE